MTAEERASPEPRYSRLGGVEVGRVAVVDVVAGRFGQKLPLLVVVHGLIYKPQRLGRGSGSRDDRCDRAGLL